MITVKKKKYGNIHFKRASDAGILVMNAYGELWSDGKLRCLKFEF